jgi:hypothetical protein
MTSDELVTKIEGHVMRALSHHTDFSISDRFALHHILMDIEREFYGIRHFCVGDMLVAKNLTQATYIAAPEVDDMWEERDQQAFIEGSG